MTDTKPGVPDVLGEVSLDQRLPDFKKRFAEFGKTIEAVLKQYEVEEYVVARKDEGSVMHLTVLPCSAEAENRAGPPEANDYEARAAAAKGTTGEEIADVVERALPLRRDQTGSSGRPGPVTPPTGPQAGLAPKPGGAGVGMRRKK